MNVNLAGYVNGSCSDEEREAIRTYIKSDFYNAFDVIGMMRDKVYEELSTTPRVKTSIDYAVDNSYDMPEMDMCVEMAPSVCRSIQMEKPVRRPRSILDMLNKYLAKD